MEKKKAVTKYRRNVDSVYENIQMLKEIIKDRDKLINLETDIVKLRQLVIAIGLDPTDIRFLQASLTTCFPPFIGSAKQ